MESQDTICGEQDQQNKITLYSETICKCFTILENVHNLLFRCISSKLFQTSMSLKCVSQLGLSYSQGKVITRHKVVQWLEM